MAWRQQPGQNLLDSPPTAAQCWEDDKAAWRQHSLSRSGLLVACSSGSYSIGFCGIQTTLLPFKVQVDSLLISYLMFFTNIEQSPETKENHKENVTRSVYPVQKLVFSTALFPFHDVLKCFFMFPHYLPISTSQNRYPMINICRKLSPRTTPWLAWDYLVNWLKMGRLPSSLSNPPLAPIQQST